MIKGFLNNPTEVKKTAIRYGIALATFAVTTAILLYFKFYEIKLNPTLAIAVALFVVAWYGGKGPGTLIVLLLEAVTLLSNPKPADVPVVNYIFSNLSGVFISLVVVFLVSSRRDFEKNLREQRELLHVTISSIGDAVIATDFDGKVTFFNPTAEALTGWTMAEAVGRPLGEIFKIINETTRQPIENPVTKVLRINNVSKLDYDTLLIARDGTEIPIDDSSAPIRAADGKIIGVILAFRDISERKQLIESDKRLQQSQKMEAIGTLTGGVAHDFNNLLTAILGNTQLALLKIHSENNVRRHLHEVEEAANRAAVLTRQLLAFSRRQHLERRPADLNETIANIFKMLQRIIGEDIEISTKYAKDLSTVFVDTAQIEQVILNLAVNARDAMPEGGRLTIETGNIEIDESYCSTYPDVKPGKYAQIIISDTGSGIRETALAHIFEPFFTTKEVGKGTGLGLSIAYGIVKQHDGNITVDSEPGHGSVFKVCLPVFEDKVEERTEVVKSALQGGNETILIAEDEETLRNLAVDILEGLGYIVLIAKNGQEAVEIYAEKSEDIDLLLFDVVMPVMGGAEAFDKISERSAASLPPVIFMTGYSSELIERRFTKQSASADGAAPPVIPKPYNIDGLGRKVREILDLQHK